MENQTAQTNTLTNEERTKGLLGIVLEVIETDLQLQQYIRKRLEQSLQSPSGRDCLQLKYRVVNKSRIPELTLSGPWMNTVGFDTNEFAQVTSMFGLIIIRPVASPLACKNVPSS